jgi:hypothetical protein
LPAKLSTTVDNIDTKVKNQVNRELMKEFYDFIIHVNGNNPSPFDFPGSESGTSVSIGPGPYAVTETKPSVPSLVPMLFSANYSKDCTKVLKNGENKTCTITNTIHL